MKLSSVSIRILTGAFTVPLLMFITLFGDIYFLILVCLIVLLGVFEFYKMLGNSRLSNFLVWGLIASVVLCLSAYYNHGRYFSTIFTLFIIIIMLARLITLESKKSTFDLSTTIFGIVFVGWMGSHFIFLRELPNRIDGLYYNLGAHFVLLTMWLTWCSDTFAYFFGISFGKHKLCPSISPKKSVEGSIGGIFGSFAGALIARYILFIDLSHYISLPHLLILGIIASIVGQLGDLVESMLKRDNKIKDTAKFIPGHGGVLDRFDSIFFTCPIFYYYIKLIVFEKIYMI